MSNKFSTCKICKFKKFGITDKRYDLKGICNYKTPNLRLKNKFI